MHRDLKMKMIECIEPVQKQWEVKPVLSFLCQYLKPWLP